MTGGAQGLGEGIVKMLVEGGAKVMIFDINDKALSSRSNVWVCKVDVSDEDSVKAGFKSTVDQLGRVDIMVNCAGIVGPNGVTVDQVSTEDFDRVYQSELPTVVKCVLCSVVTSRN